MSTEDRPPRRSVDELRRYYWHPTGAGYRRALSEAKALLDAGAPIEEAAEFVGWAIPQLLRGLPAEYSRRAPPGAAA